MQELTRRQVLKMTGGLAGLSALAASGLLAACAPKAAPTAAPAKATAAPAAQPTAAVAPVTECEMDWSPTFPPAPKKYDPPVEVSVIWEMVSMDFPAEGTWAWDNNPMYNQCVQNTGLKPIKHWEAYADLQTQKLAADLAAGTLPDYFHAGGLFREQLIDAEAIEEIKDIWDATASPLTIEKKMYPDYKWWIPNLRGDKMYGIPFTWGPALNVDNLCFARQDWLEQLGVQAPETVEDWGTVAAAFRDAGLAQFGISACKNLVTWYHSLDPIFGAYGVMPGCWVPAGDGTLKYDSISAPVKEALAVIRQWYEDGLMDPDFYTYSEGDAAGHVGTNKVGIFTAPWWAGGGQVKLEQDNPPMKLGIIPYPKGPDGKQGRKGSAEVQDSVVFRKGLDPIKIEAAINNLNWHIEKHVNWEKYQQYGEWRNSASFDQGFAWDFDENCELVDGPFPGGNVYNYMQQVDFGFAYLTYPDYQVQPFRDMTAWLEQDPATLNKAQRYLVSSLQVRREMEYYPYAFDTQGIAIVNEWWGIPTEAMKTLSPDLGTLESQVLTNIVTGNEPLDRFDAFAEEWMSQGGSEVTRDVNEWWSSIQG